MRKIVTTNLYPIFLSKTSNLFIFFGFFLDFARSTGKTTFVSIIVLTNKIPLKIGPTWPLIPPDSFRFIRPRGTTFSKGEPISSQLRPLPRDTRDPWRSIIFLSAGRVLGGAASELLSVEKNGGVDP